MVTSLRPRPGPVRSYQFPDFTDEMLPGGIRLVTAPVRKLPVTTVLVVVDAGSTTDPAGKEGIAALTAGTLLEGSKRFDGAELAEQFEQLGTSVESGADWDSAFIKLTTLSDRLVKQSAVRPSPSGKWNGSKQNVWLRSYSLKRNREGWLTKSSPSSCTRPNPGTRSRTRELRRV
jgi:hypothetical protein